MYQVSSTVFVIWLENVDPELLSAVSSFEYISTNGIDIHLTPYPLAENRACYYQTLTGMGSGKLGYFDSVKPIDYHVHSEENTPPDGALGHLLPNILHARGLPSIFLEAEKWDELDGVAHSTQACTIVRAPIENNADAIEGLIKRYTERLTKDSYLLILTDVWHEPAAKFVNPNNFLADIGLLEVNTPRSRENITWSETLAYYLGSGQIWINLREREPQGSVSVGREHQQVCEAIQQELMAWRDPDTNAAIVKRVLKKEDAYKGNYLFQAPDLIVEYQPGYAPSPNAMQLDFDTSAVYSTGNSKTGTAKDAYARLIAVGPNLVKGQRENARLVDVMPTIVYLLDQAVPGHVDGEVISTVFTQLHRQQHPQERIEDDEFLLTGDEEGQVEERLRALGYLG
jgi:hypothetical protein